MDGTAISLLQREQILDQVLEQIRQPSTPMPCSSQGCLDKPAPAEMDCVAVSSYWRLTRSGDDFRQPTGLLGWRLLSELGRHSLGDTWASQVSQAIKPTHRDRVRARYAPFTISIPMRTAGCCPTGRTRMQKPPRCLPGCS